MNCGSSAARRRRAREQERERGRKGRAEREEVCGYARGQGLTPSAYVHEAVWLTSGRGAWVGVGIGRDLSQILEGLFSVTSKPILATKVNKYSFCSMTIFFEMIYTICSDFCTLLHSSKPIMELKNQLALFSTNLSYRTFA